MEEIGKAYASNFYAYECQVNPRPGLKFEEEWFFELFTSHRMKQLSFMKYVYHESDAMKKLAKAVSNKQLDSLKQNSIYVGIPKPPPGKPRTFGKINDPVKTVDRLTARRQVKLVNDFLQSEALASVDYDKDFSLKTFKSIFNRSLRERLEGQLL